ncbi:uncharacterized protein SCHCODRAFT_02608120 [Schizophyllum commune H4-8]|uniref:uncharacterized protein n=1 Tax=Schizophyllum commune (strain H4-8 / FGSC 9210) TaxID=578458 RepID=UPI00215DFC1C|nr:uncharacterized protein SCHCODRAFT_02608120 [Schizophyllum commune H4-8]KAI5900516.1 hypothetical protein SCHCODRAFT_02608120 [Schizophyllum commune H4-8]
MWMPCGDIYYYLYLSSALPLLLQPTHKAFCSVAAYANHMSRICRGLRDVVVAILQAITSKSDPLPESLVTRIADTSALLISRIDECSLACDIAVGTLFTYGKAVDGRLSHNRVVEFLLPLIDFFDLRTREERLRDHARVEILCELRRLHQDMTSNSRLFRKVRDSVNLIKERYSDTKCAEIRQLPEDERRSIEAVMRQTIHKLAAWEDDWRMAEELIMGKAEDVDRRLVQSQASHSPNDFKALTESRGWQTSR